tara:strand:+ start:21538 stop:24003 length:2466 start_codon:yes stop_codon:yes gene_type:complete
MIFDKKFESFYNLISDYKYAFLTIIILITIFNFTNINKFKLDASADTLILENDTDYKIFKDINKIFKNKEFLVLAYKTKNDSITEYDVKQINNLKIAIENINGIDSTFSIINAPLIMSSNQKLTDLNTNDIKTILSKKIRLNEALEELKNNPIFKDQIISQNGKVSSIIAYLEENKEIDDIIHKRENLIEKINKDTNNKLLKNELKIINDNYELLKNELNSKRHDLISQIRIEIINLNLSKEVYLGGVAMIADDSIQFVKKDIINFGIGVVIFIVIILFLMFRNIKWVIFPILTTSFAILTVISILGILQWKVTVISSNFISLLIILTISMNIHIIVRYQLLSNNKLNKENVALTMREMLAPCFYTSITTIVAFVSLIFSDIRPVIDFGWIMTISLIISFLSSFTVLPTLIIFFPTSKIYKNKNYYIINSLFNLVKKHGSIIISANIILFIISIFGIKELKVENSFINYFKKDTEIYRGMKLIDQNLGGTTPLDIIIKFKSEQNSKEKIDDSDEELFELEDLYDDEVSSIDYWITDEKLSVIHDIHNYLENRKEIGKVQSVQLFIDTAEIINGKPLTNFELLILYKSIPDELKSDLLGSYISLENDIIRMSARVFDSNNIERNKLINEINNDLKNKYENVESIKVNGLLVLYNNMLQSLFSSQIKSVIFVLIAIFIMFLILFKSITLSIAGIIPNIFAASFILGLIGIFRIPLDMMTITIAAITIGIAVDNSIHYIYRIKKELPLNESLINTIRICHQTVGNAILTTSMTIAFGFSILLLSNFMPTIYFGIFTGIAMIVAMMGIMTTLPKILLLLKFKNVD